MCTFGQRKGGGCGSTQTVKTPLHGGVALMALPPCCALSSPLAFIYSKTCEKHWILIVPANIPLSYPILSHQNFSKQSIP